MLRSLASVVVLASAVAAAAVPSPTVEGPVMGGRGVPFAITTAFSLSKVNYMVEEFFISGTANAYMPVGTLGSNGRWDVAPGATAAYKTRLLVYRPVDPRKFKGTVVVEWFNVSGGLDTGVIWTTAHTEMIREGIAWVGVSAQKAGVESGPPIVGGINAPLKTADPVRYGSLVHPGDSFSYDIFSQAGEAIRHPAGPSPLGGMKVRKVIAIGKSQSAFRMVTYIDAVHPLADVYDGFLVDSRGIDGAALSEAPQPDLRVPRPALIRTDLRVPVLTFETETDLVPLSSNTDTDLLQYFHARQRDTSRFRLWEVAGTAQSDTYTLAVGMADLGDDPAAMNLVVTATPVPGVVECPSPINSGPQHLVLDAAVRALNRWVRHGAAPPRARRLNVFAGPPPAIVRDAHGNALGGIRTPAVDVPIAALSGGGQTDPVTCRLSGTTVPFDAATLGTIYPDHGRYVAAFRKATRRAVRAGFVVPADAKLMIESAAASPIGG